MAPPYKPTKKAPGNPNVPFSNGTQPPTNPNMPGLGKGLADPGHATDVPGSNPHAGSNPAAPAAPVDVGHGADLGGARTSFWDLPVLKRQQMLRQAGYDVTVDGQPGPQTFTASKAYLKGIPPAYWNLAWKRNHTPAPAPPASTDSSSSGAQDTSTQQQRTTQSTPAGPDQLKALLDLVLGNLGKGTVSTADLIAQAKAMADASLLPYKTELERQQTQAITDANRRAQFQGNLGGALAELEKSQGPAVESAYRQAGADQAGYAKGFATDFANSANADAAKTNEFLKSIGAPNAQMLDTSKGGAIGDLLYGTGGFIPANALAREGAAYSAAADLLPQTAVGNGQQLAARELAAGRDAKSKLGQQLIDLQLQRPKLMSDAVSQLQTSALQSRAQQQNEALLPLLLAKDFENFPGTNPLTGLPTKTQTSIDLQVGSQKIRLAELDLTTRKTLAALTGQDPATGAPTPEMQRLLLNQWKATHPKQAKLTPQQIVNAKRTVVATVNEGFWGVPDPANGGWKSEPKSYQQVLGDLLSVYSGVLPLDYIQNQLNRLWTKPGYDFDPNDRKDHKLTPVQTGDGRPKQRLRITLRRK